VKARDNPFSVGRIEKIRYRAVGTGFEGLVVRLEEMGYRAAIIGAEGSGKTTLLEDLQACLDSRGLRTRSVFVNDTTPFTRSSRKRLFLELAGDEIVLLDGADAMGRFAWRGLSRRVLKAAAGLVITAHKSGLLPTLIECETTPALFRKIAGELLRGDEKLSADLLNGIYHRHNGNIRMCLRELYDIYANDQNLDIDKVWTYHSTLSQTD